VSTYWTLHCRTCDSEDRPTWWNHGDAELRELVKLLPAIANLQRAQETHRTELALEITIVGPEWTNGLGAFALKHDGHDVAVKNEYGAYDDRCGEWFHCHNDDCARAMACGLENGHSGSHRNGPE